jgi:probable rRNA maturation factor
LHAVIIAMIIIRGRVAGVSDITLARFVTRVRKTIPLRGLVNVVVTTNSEMKRLNGQFRGKDEPTDVLSFPGGVTGGLAGEIAISHEIAKENAGQLGHSITEEIKILILHGMLHLAGYDHEDDNGKMARREHHLRKALRLPDALIERSITESRTALPPVKTKLGRVREMKR